MSTLVDAVRRAGAGNPVMLGGLDWANDLDGWLAHQPNDPDHALMASWHVYDENPCSDENCWRAHVLPVAERVPLVTGEVGLTADCSTRMPSAVLPFMDQHGLSYLAWTWNDWN